VGCGSFDKEKDLTPYYGDPRQRFQKSVLLAPPTRNQPFPGAKEGQNDGVLLLPEKAILRQGLQANQRQKGYYQKLGGSKSGNQKKFQSIW